MEITSARAELISWLNMLGPHYEGLTTETHNQLKKLDYNTCTLEQIKEIMVDGGVWKSDYIAHEMVFSCYCNECKEYKAFTVSLTGSYRDDGYNTDSVEVCIQKAHQMLKEAHGAA